jgi:dolichol kinase
MMSSVAIPEVSGSIQAIDEESLAHRLTIANRVFKGALWTNAVLTLFCIVAYTTGVGSSIAGSFEFNVKSVVGVLIGILMFHVIWGFVWYGVKNLLLSRFVGFTKAERVAAFSSRMSQPFEVRELVGRYSERRIRITDMIGRRGRFITIGLAAFFYLYAFVGTNRPDNFATAFLNANLIDGVLASWLYLAMFYRSNIFTAALYGPQSRVMDGTLARANCLLIITLWTLFKFVLLPIGTQLGHLYSPAQFAVIFALIWGSYMITDTLAEVGGALYGKQKIRVLGIGDINRKSVAGTVTGFVGALAFCVGLVLVNGLPPIWLLLALCISVSNSVLELISPRGTDDFTMATGNALICWAFGAWML